MSKNKRRQNGKTKLLLEPISMESCTVRKIMFILVNGYDITIEAAHEKRN